jgi:DNA-binding transcriptional regulator GbsR (MarR family)
MTRDRRGAFVEHAAGVFIAQGFPPMPARVLIALTASDEGRLTSEELQKQLDVSAAAVSGAVRYLQTLGFVLRATEPGGRRHVYRLVSNVPWYTGSLSRAAGMRQIAEILGESREAIPAESPAHARIEEMIAFFHFLERRMPELLEEWQQLRRSDETAV